MSETLITALTALVMLVGLVGTLVPVLPDLFLIWLAALGYGLLVGWGEWGVWLFAGITLLALVGAAAEVAGSGVGSRVGGASLWGVLGGLALGLVGLIFFTPLGGVAGLLVGTFLVEWLRTRDARRAARGTLGAGVGLGLGVLAKVALGLLMIALWVVWVVV